MHRLVVATVAGALTLSLGPASTALAGGAVDPVRAAAVAGGSVPRPSALVAAPAPASTRVLAISVDGLNPTAIKRLGPTRAPTFYKLLREGASTLNARTSYEQTVTLPNHAGMMTGRRIDRRKGGHGVTWDDDRRGSTVQKAAGHAVSSVFSVVHAAGGSTALFTTKTKFSLYERSWPRDIDRYTVNENHAALIRAVTDDLVRSNRAFTFLHVSLPDRTGHAKGFMSRAYVDAVHATDGELATVLRTITSQPALADNTVVVVTSDHGGFPGSTSHSFAARVQDYRVPFLVWGAGVADGDLYRLNADYRDPGRGRPGYSGPQPVRNADLADLATGLLGLAPVPGSELDAKQDLTVLTGG